MVAATSEWAPPIGPNTIRANQKWAGGNGADLFARQGEPVYAIADGTVEQYNGVMSPVGPVPSFILRTARGVTAQYTHTVLTARGQVRKGQQIGYVGDQGMRVLGAYPGMPDDFQHLDFTIGYGGPFPVTGGQINANDWLNSIGYRGRVFNGQTRGPNGAGGGGSTIGNLSAFLNPFMQQFGGQGGAGIGGLQNVSNTPLGLGNAPLTGGSYSLLSGQYQVGGTPSLDNEIGGLIDGSSGGSTSSGASDALAGLAGISEGLSSLSSQQFQFSQRKDFENPFQGIPEAWTDLIPYAVAAIIVAGGVGLIEHGEEHGGAKSPAILLAILVIAGVFLFRKSQEGGTVADSVVGALNALAPSLQQVVNMPQQNSIASGNGTTSRPVSGNNVGLPSIVNGAQNLASRALGIALTQRGQPYTWAGATPAQGFDCSGLVQWAYAQAGINLPRTAQTQFNATQRVSQNEAKAGDLVFFEYTDPTQRDRITHVGIYMGNGQMLDAPQPGSRIGVRPVSAVRNLAGFGRIGQ